MPDTQPVFRQGRGEEYAVYTGQVSASFAPGLAGITYPDPLYEIYRPRGIIMSLNMSSPGQAMSVRMGKASLWRRGTPTSCSREDVIIIILTRRIPGRRYGSMWAGAW